MQYHRFRLPLVALAIVCLASALWAGLIRLGWQLDPILARLPQAHGPLMVSGFLGTLIGVERAVALSLTNDRLLLYVGPLLSGAGSLLFMAGLPGSLGPLLIALGSLSMVSLFLVLAFRIRTLFAAMLLLGALAWFSGNLVWIFGGLVSQAVWWWAGFLIFTITGERLELSRIGRPSRRQQHLFLGVNLLLAVGLLTSLVRYATGVTVIGISLMLLSFWLVRNDIARRTIRQVGLPRFVAVALLTGYGWLGVAGVLAMRYGGASAGPYYDAMIHAIFLGFVMVMIFAHAPIIFPSVLGRPMAYTRFFYVHLLLLHLTLLLRIFADLNGWITARQWGGLLNTLVILFFLANTVRATRGVKTDLAT